MPIFEYVCKDCGKDFEALVMRAKGNSKANCPACEGKKVERKLSVFAVASAAPKSPPSSSACGSCGDPRGPGACSLKNGVGSGI